MTEQNNSMTTTPEFQINYGSMNFGAQSARPDPDAPRYAAIDAMVAPLSSDEYAFIAKDSGERHVLTHHVLQTLDQCREFRTIDEHVARVASVVPGLTQHDRIRKGLEGLAKTGLLVSDGDYLTALEREPESQPRSLHAIYIRACDRPQQLRLLLDSLANYERRFRVARNVVLLDDSIEESNRDTNRDLLREFARAVGNPVSYIGPVERSKLRQRLGKAVPQAASSLEWLLDRGPRTRRGGGGRSWNLALLLSAGRMFAMLDEDFRLPLHRHADVQPGLEPNPAVAASARFYRRLEDALVAGEEESQDPFEAHLQICGDRLGAAVTQEGYRLSRDSLRGINLGRLEHLRVPTAAQSSGLIGSPICAISRHRASGTETCARSRLPRPTSPRSCSTIATCCRARIRMDAARTVWPVRRPSSAIPAHSSCICRWPWAMPRNPTASARR